MNTKSDKQTRSDRSKKSELQTVNRTHNSLIMSWKLPKTARWLLLLLMMTMTTALKSLMKLVDQDSQTAYQDRQDVSSKSCFSLHDADVDIGGL